MNPKVAEILKALAPALEAAVEGAATVAGGPVAGAAATAVIEGALNPALGLGVAVDTPKPTAVTPAAPTASVATSASVSTADFQALQAQMAQLVAAMAAQNKSVATAAGADTSNHRDPVPGVGVQPVVVDPNSHPVLVAAGRAAMVPSPPAATDRDLPDNATIPDIIDAVNALHSKVDALVEASGLGGSAAMAGHA